MKFITLIPLLLCLSSPAYSKNSPFDRNVENTTFLNPACPATLTGVYADSKGKGRVSVHLVNQTGGLNGSMQHWLGVYQRELVRKTWLLD
jgi:hypothetical protein